MDPAAKVQSWRIHDPRGPRSDHAHLSFRDFIRLERGVLILEGAAFQNTIRFMFANARPEAEISDYMATWAISLFPAKT